MTQGLTEKEKLFCFFYANLPSPRQAAAKAGYRRAERTAAKLLMREEIQQEIQRQRAGCGMDAVKAGLHQLAFGSCKDAVKLLFEEEPPENDTLEQMDFFNVAEIKRPKNGGMEVKFFDRAKAMDQLVNLQEREQAGESPLFEALRQGAKSLWEGDS